jgi:hypothetical protein
MARPPASRSQRANGATDARTNVVSRRPEASAGNIGDRLSADAGSSASSTERRDLSGDQRRRLGETNAASDQTFSGPKR